MLAPSHFQGLTLVRTVRLNASTRVQDVSSLIRPASQHDENHNGCFQNRGFANQLKAVTLELIQPHRQLRRRQECPVRFA